MSSKFKQVQQEEENTDFYSAPNNFAEKNQSLAINLLSPLKHDTSISSTSNIENKNISSNIRKKNNRRKNISI